MPATEPQFRAYREPVADTGSREVSWAAVHHYLADTLGRAERELPEVGTHAWLAADDHTKVLALLRAGERWALMLEGQQADAADAAADLATDDTYGQIARELADTADIARTTPWLAPYGTHAHRAYLTTNPAA